MTHKNIIGFLDLRDFEKELLNTLLAPPIVRLQDFKKTESRPGAFIRFHNYYVEAAFVHGDEVRTCRFKIAEVGAFDDPSPEQRQKIQAADRASHLARLALKTYLSDLGYDVRPGLIAGSEQSKALAPLSTLFIVTGQPDEEPLPFTDETTAEEAA